MVVTLVWMFISWSSSVNHIHQTGLMSNRASAVCNWIIYFWCSKYDPLSCCNSITWGNQFKLCIYAPQLTGHWQVILQEFTQSCHPSAVKVSPFPFPKSYIFLLLTDPSSFGVTAQHFCLLKHPPWGTLCCLINLLYDPNNNSVAKSSNYFPVKEEWCIMVTELKEGRKCSIFQFVAVFMGWT